MKKKFFWRKDKMKKRSLLFVLAFVLVFVLVLATGCNQHEHVWGEWTITTQPTETAKGTAVRSCVCSEKETQELAVLTDTSVWTLNETPATHETEGKKVYTSTYGTVEITLPKLSEHAWGNWTITTEPTLENTGSANRSCACGETDTVTLPALTDATVWTKDADSSVAATCQAEGKDVYASQYGNVEVTLPKAEHTWREVAEVAANCATGANGTAAHWECDFCHKLFVERDGAKVEVSAEDLVIVAEHTPREVAEVAANCATGTNGTAAHWECDVCHKLFVERDGAKVEVSAEDLVIAAEHTYKANVCETCGAVISESQILEKLFALSAGQSLGGTYQLTGTITEIVTPWSSQYKNITVNIQVGEKVVQCFRLKSGDTTDASALVVGQEITVLGALKNYNGTYEFDSGCTLVAVAVAEVTLDVQIANGTTTPLQPTYNSGDTVSFKVTANEGYKVASVKVNGSEITADSEGTYSFVIGGNTVVAVEIVENSVVVPELAASISFDTIDNRVSLSNTQQVWQQNGITFTNDKAGSSSNVVDFSNPVRCYQGSTITIDFPAMVKIVFNCNSTTYAADLGKTIAGSVVSGKIVTVELAQAVDTFTTANLVKQVRINSIDVYTVPAPQHVHNFVAVDEVAANCATGTNGTAAHFTCSCGKLFVEQNGEKVEVTAEDLVIVAAHQLGDVVKGTATCDQPGTRDYRVCSVCSAKCIEIDGVWTAITSDSELQTEALGHNWIWVETKAPTCTAEGRERQECSRCEEINLDENEKPITRTIAKLPHTVDESTLVVVEPDCTNAGSTSYNCAVCGQLITEEGAPALGHETTTLLSWIVAPTLTEGGEGHFRCHCGAEWDSAVVALSDASVWTVGAIVVKQTYNTAEITQYNASFGSVNIQTKAKLVAPYDGKTYASIRSFIREDESKMEIWADVGILTVGADGIGYGEAAPFRGKFVFSVVNAETGEISVTCYSIKSSSSSGSGSEEGGWGEGEGEWGEGEYYALTLAEGEVEYETEPYYTYTCWIDWETGIFTLPNNGKNTALYICVPSETQLANDAITASYWGTTMAISYEDSLGNVMNVFSTLEKVYLGVTFRDLEGNEIAAADCATSNSVRIANGEGTLIKAFGRTHGEDARLVETDGMEGTYTSGGVTIQLDGVGGIKITDGNGTTEGLYTASANDEGFALSCILNNVYKEITLDGDGMSAEGGAFTVEEPKVSITFNLNGVESEQPVSDITEASKNVPVALPANLTNETKVFVGWFTDEYGNNPVQLNSDGLYVPTEDVTLFAKWANKVIVYVQGTLEGNVTLFVGDGDVLVEKLPSYVAKETLTADGKHYFGGWYIIVDGEEVALDGTEEISQEDSGITVYAKWVEVPVYAGTYYGTELWNKNYGNSAKVYVTIDLDGKVTSGLSEINNATITGYDAATQVLTYRRSNGTEKRCYLDAETGVLAGLYSTNVIGNDYYILSKAHTSSNYKVVESFGVNATQPGSSARNFYLQFVTLETVLGTKTLVLFNNHIYNNATIQSATGETLATPSDVANSKTVVVKVNGTILAAVASAGSSFTSNTTTVDLDEHFGIYTSEGKPDLSLDGAGSFVWGEKVGTYTLVSNEENKLFDIYVVANGENTEYYKLTIIGNSYVEEKPMSYVTYQMVAPQGATLPDSIERVYVNTNIAISLPNGADINTAFVFNGFFADAECTQAIDGEFTPTAANNVIYVKYSNPAILTKVFNDGTTANEEIRYSVGDNVTIALPTWEKHALVGWFLQDGTETGEWGEQWIDGTAITESTTVYAKWEVAPVFNQTYGTIWINKTTNGFGTNSSADKRGNPFTFDPYGNYDLKGSFPLNNYATQLVEFDKVNGTIKVLSNVSNSNFYGGRDAFIDVETGLIIVNYKVDNADWSSVFAFVPGGTSQLSSYSESYWNGGKSKAVSFSVGEVDYAILISGSQVYIGTHFVDQTGATVNGEKAIESATISVKKGENVVATVHPCFTLTLVYGNGIKTETKTVLAGGFDMADYQPEYKNGQMLTGWYTTSTFDVGTEFNAATANSDVTVYGKWEDHDPYVLSSTGSYAWTETDGVWSSGNKGKGNTTSELKLTALADMMVTVSAGASGEKNYDYLYISLNGTKQYDKIGTADNTISFKTYSFKLKANDVLTFAFKKDGSGDKGIDTAQVKDIAVELIVPITLTYNFNVAEKENVVVNMKSHDVVEELLAVTESVGTKVFAGWYTTAECLDGTEFEVGTELTTSTEVFAKWTEKATLTIVYGNGLANFDWDLVPGETFNLAEKIPSYTNGKIFAGWYTTAECTDGTEFTAETISENTTIYCKWVESAPATVKNAGGYKWTYNAETGIWQTNNKGYDNSNCIIEITALADVTVTFSYRASSENATKWDWFHVVRTGSVSSDTCSTGGSGSIDSKAWLQASFSLASGDVLKLTYQKDGSSAGGDDIAQIKDLQINGIAIVSAN